MESSVRTRLASLGVLFLVFVTGFLLGLAWDRTDGLLQADESEYGSESPHAEGAGTGIDRRSPSSGGSAANMESARGDEVSRRAKADGRPGGDGKGDARDRDDGEGDDGRLIVHRVGITPTQEARVDSIVEVHRDRVRELREAMKEEYDPRFRALRRERDSVYEPRFGAVLMQTRRSIRSVLSADQAVLYDSLLAEHDRKEAERKRREAEARKAEGRKAEGKERPR